MHGSVCVALALLLPLLAGCGGGEPRRAAELSPRAEAAERQVAEERTLMPRTELAALSAAFDTLLPDAAVSELLRRHAVEPREIFLSAEGIEVSHRVQPGQPLDSAIADARLVAAAYPRDILCHAPHRITGLLGQQRPPAPAGFDFQEVALRGELAQVQRLRAALRAARAGAPVIYGVTVTGSAEDLAGLSRDPLVRALEWGTIATVDGFERLRVVPPRRPPGLRSPAALPPESEALPLLEVHARLERLLREGIEECRDDPLGTPRPVPDPALERRAERLLFVCDWTPQRPAAERIVADIRLRSGDANRLPTEEDLQALRSAGARVLHVFNVAMVRVEIATDRIPTLIRGRSAIAEWAATVPDPASYEVELQIFFGRPAQEEDLRALEALGVRVLGGLGQRGVLYAVAPDAAVPQIAQLPRVTNVRAQAMACAQPLEGSRSAEGRA